MSNEYNFKLAYSFQSGGNKGSLVFIHGAGGTKEKWRYQLAEPFSDFISVALDLPGHGQSEGMPLSSIQEYSQAIIRFALELKLPAPLIIVGHSMGGAIALQTGITYSAHIGGLILIDTGASLKVNQSFLSALKEGKVSRSFLSKAYGAINPQDWVAEQVQIDSATPPSLLFKDFSVCNEYHLEDSLKSIKVPCLILVGKNDIFTPPSKSLYLKDNLPNAQMFEIPLAGHYTMLEDPSAVNQAINRFIQQ